MPARKKRKPYDRGELRMLKESGYALLSNDNQINHFVYDLLARLGDPPSSSDMPMYALCFVRGMPVFRNLREKDPQAIAKASLLEAIRKGTDSKHPGEKAYWKREIMRYARELGRFNYFSPGNMLMRPFRFEGERIRFGKPYEYDKKSPSGRSPYDRIAPSTKPYTTTSPQEKRDAFADFALHLPEYAPGQRKIIFVN